MSKTTLTSILKSTLSLIVDYWLATGQWWLICFAFGLDWSLRTSLGFWLAGKLLSYIIRRSRA